MNIAHNHHSKKNVIKNVVVRARVNSVLKNDVEVLLDGLGLTISEAINVYLAQIKLRGGLPFSVEIPNKETAKAIREARAGKGMVVCKNAGDMFKKLGI